MGKDLREAFETLTPLQQAAQRTGDAVLAGDLSIEEGISNIEHAIAAVEMMFKKAKIFLEAEPTREEFDGSIIAFGPVQWPSALDLESLETIMAQVAGEDPNLMFHTNPSVACISEVPYFARLPEMLLKEVRQIKKVDSPMDGWVSDQLKHWDINRRILIEDIESTKRELQKLDNGDGSIHLVPDYLQHLQELTQRWTLLQAFEEDGLLTSQISDLVPNETGDVTLTELSVQDWLHFRKQRLERQNWEPHLGKLE